MKFYSCALEKIEDENNFNEGKGILGSRFWAQGLGQTFTRSEIRSPYLIAIHRPISSINILISKFLNLNVRSF